MRRQEKRRAAAELSQVCGESGYGSRSRSRCRRRRRILCLSLAKKGGKIWWSERTNGTKNVNPRFLLESKHTEGNRQTNTISGSHTHTHTHTRRRREGAAAAGERQNRRESSSSSASNSCTGCRRLEEHEHEHTADRHEASSRRGRRRRGRGRGRDSQAVRQRAGFWIFADRSPAGCALRQRSQFCPPDWQDTRTSVRIYQLLSHPTDKRRGERRDLLPSLLMLRLLRESICWTARDKRGEETGGDVLRHTGK